MHGVFSGDGSSPINAGQLLLFPSAALFRDGVRVLTSATFSKARGWDGAGSVDEALAGRQLLHSDGLPYEPAGAGRDRAGRGRIPPRAWDFVGADIDQGFLLYMLLIRTSHGRYASAGHTYSVAHYMFTKPWLLLRAFHPEQPSWVGRPLEQMCAANRYLKKLKPVFLNRSGRSGPLSACATIMQRELFALRAALLVAPLPPWPFCLTHCDGSSKTATANSWDNQFWVRRTVPTSACAFP